MTDPWLKKNPSMGPSLSAASRVTEFWRNKALAEAGRQASSLVAEPTLPHEAKSKRRRKR